MPDSRLNRKKASKKKFENHLLIAFILLAILCVIFGDVVMGFIFEAPTAVAAPHVAMPISPAVNAKTTYQNNKNNNRNNKITNSDVAEESKQKKPFVPNVFSPADEVDDATQTTNYHLNKPVEAVQTPITQGNAKATSLQSSFLSSNQNSTKALEQCKYWRCKETVFTAPPTIPQRPSLEHIERAYCYQTYQQNTPLCREDTDLVPFLPALDSYRLQSFYTKEASAGKWHDVGKKCPKSTLSDSTCPVYIPGKCCFFKYLPGDAQANQCLQDKKINMIGDSQVRTLFHCMKMWVSGGSEEGECFRHLSPVHSDLSYQQVKFFWMTTWNKKETAKVMHKVHARSADIVMMHPGAHLKIDKANWFESPTTRDNTAVSIANHMEQVAVQGLETPTRVPIPDPGVWASKQDPSQAWNASAVERKAFAFFGDFLFTNYSRPWNGPHDGGSYYPHAVVSHFYHRMLERSRENNNFITPIESLRSTRQVQGSYKWRHNIAHWRGQVLNNKIRVMLNYYCDRQADLLAWARAQANTPQASVDQLSEWASNLINANT